MDQYLGKILDGRYEMLDIIGTGGMSVVYRARDVKLNRFVAIKMLKEELLDDDDLRHRFHTESEAVAALNHQNIVKIYDTSNSGEGEYFVMELVDGITLKQYIQQRGVLSPKEAMHFSIQILKALDHAHTHNVIHRDIKPQNIMLLRDGTVKVTDFGIARIASKQNTVSQSAFGSVHYISPEQAKGEDTDGRSDIYSVGVMMYEMLTARLPYEGDTPVSVALQHIQGQPKPPSFYNPTIPQSLENIVLKAMCGNLYYRYSTAQHMLGDLEEMKKNPDAVIAYELAVDEKTPTRKMDKLAQKKQSEELRKVSKEEQMKKTQKKEMSIPILIGVIFSIVFLAVAIVIFLAIILPGNFSGAEIAAPKLIGMQYEDALKIGSENDEYAQLALIKETETYDSRPAGEIIAQDPRPDMPIKRNSEIKLTVSLGLRADLIPAEVVEMERVEALNYLQSYFTKKSMTVHVTPKEEYHDDIAKGYVTRTDPEAGSTVKDGDTIVLYVSKGVEMSEIKMPNLISLQEADAKRILQENNLTFEKVEWENSAFVKGEVCDMRFNGASVKPGDTIMEGSKIVLVLSKGPVAEEQPDNVTNPVYFPLPSYSYEMNVKITENGVLKYDETHYSTDRSITYNVTGPEGSSVKVQLYVDDELYDEKTITLQNTGVQDPDETGNGEETTAAAGN